MDYTGAAHGKPGPHKKKQKGRLSPGAYKRLCKELLAERGPMCQECKERPSVNAHHIIFRSQGGPDTEENLILLCDECHRKKH